MGLFSRKKFETMDQLLLEQLQDLYDAEMRISQALPKMAEAAASAELTKAFQKHLAETEQQVTRLESVFQKLGQEPARETCHGIKGLLSEGSEMISAEGDPALKDAALIAAAQRVEHYEMAGYGTARSMASSLGHTEVARLLQKTLDEEGATDKKLTKIAEGSIYESKSPKAGKAAKSGRAKGTQAARNARRASSSGSASRPAANPRTKKKAKGVTRKKAARR